MRSRNLVWFRKYTTLAGGAAGAGQDFLSEPLDVVPYATLVVEYALAAAIGTGATVKAQLQTGNDLAALEDTGSEETLTVGTPVRQVYAAPGQFVRVRVNLSTGSGKMVATLWAVGVARES